jgi:hypothetical protein
MTESAGMTLIVGQLNALTEFTSTGSTPNVAIAKWQLLSKGFSAYYAILRPGPHMRPRISMRMRDNAYRTVIEVWYRYKDDGTTLTNLIGLCNTITARFDKYPKLGDSGGTIRIAEIDEEGEVKQWPEGADTPQWLVRELYVDWKEESNPSYAE